MDGLTRAIEGDDDRETDSDFCCSDGDDEEDEHLAVVVRKPVRGGIETGKCDQ